MLPIKKIYIDTRPRTAGSASHSDFSVDLPTTILMPEDTGFYVEDICIPVSWWTLEEGVNDFIFWSHWTGSFEAVTQSAIPPGVYNAEELGTAIVTSMNGSFTTLRYASACLKLQNAIVIKWLDSFIGTDVVRYFKVFTNSEAL